MSVSSAVPDLVEPIIGWRVWAVYLDDPTTLRSPMRPSTIWQVRERIEAVYEAGNRRCGINAYSSSHPLIDQGHPRSESCEVVGKVALWGRVQEFPLGYRAQLAYPHTLYASSPDQEPLVRDLAQRYGVIYGGLLRAKLRLWRVASIIAFALMLVVCAIWGALILQPDHGEGWALLTWSFLGARILWVALERPSSLYLHLDAEKPVS